MRIISAFPKGLTARPRRPLRARRANFRPTPDRQTASCDWSASLSRLRALTTMAPPARVTATVLFLTNCAVNAYKMRSSVERGLHWDGGSNKLHTANPLERSNDGQNYKTSMRTFTDDPSAILGIFLLSRLAGCSTDWFFGFRAPSRSSENCML